MYDKHLRRLIYSGYLLLETEIIETLSMGERSKSEHKFVLLLNQGTRSNEK